MGCSHNFVYTQGYFVCTKCGKRSYGRAHKRKQGKKITAGIIIGFIAVIGIFAYSNGIFEINQEKLEETIQNFSNEIPIITDNIPSVPSQVSKPLQDIQLILKPYNTS